LTWTQGEEAFITVRLKRDASVRSGGDERIFWVDDGSTFRAQYRFLYAPRPPSSYGCDVDRDETYWVGIRRFDQPGAAGHPTSSIQMSRLPGDDVLYLEARMGGGPSARWYQSRSCEIDRLDVGEWDSQAVAYCPVKQIGFALGSLDASGTRVDFDCVDAQTFSTPDGQLRDLTRIDGYIRLVP
jgi:hypothetical protein